MAKNYTVYQMKKAVGRCPRCGKLKGLWLNGVPLQAFCWGTEEKPHPQWSKIVPLPQQPYKGCKKQKFKLNPTDGMI